MLTWRKWLILQINGIVERTGIRERHLAAEHEMTSDLAVAAARQAIAAADIDVAKIDLVIVATTTPDLVFPSTACLVQNKLGMSNGCAAFDVQAVCSGFVYALSIADNFIARRTGTICLGDRGRDAVADH